MEEENKINEMYNRYLIERQGFEISPELFRELVIVFPVILVLQADGYIDTREMQYLNKLITQITQKLKNITENQVRQEIRFLTWGARIWREPILDTLILTLKNDATGLKENILEMMLQGAGTSTGSVSQNIYLGTVNPMGNTVLGAYMKPDITSDFIDGKEMEEMLEISEYLGLTESSSAATKLKNIS